MESPTVPPPHDALPKFILSLDGGGVRGVLPARILLDLEERFAAAVARLAPHLYDADRGDPKPQLAEAMDVMAGTSTGGIIALALNCRHTRNGDTAADLWTASDVVRLYTEHGRDIFTHTHHTAAEWKGHAIGLVGAFATIYLTWLRSNTTLDILRHAWPPSGVAVRGLLHSVGSTGLAHMLGSREGVSKAALWDALPSMVCRAAMWPARNAFYARLKGRKGGAWVWGNLMCCLPVDVSDSLVQLVHGFKDDAPFTRFLVRGLLYSLLTRLCMMAWSGRFNPAMQSLLIARSRRQHFGARLLVLCASILANAWLRVAVSKLLSHVPIVDALAVLMYPRFRRTGLDSILRTYFGDHRLGDARSHVLVTSFCGQRRRGVSFSNMRAAQHGVRMREAAASTSAAPVYFAPFELDGVPYLDGGLVANNPVLVAYAEAVRSGVVERRETVFILSLGTGEVPRVTTKRLPWWCPRIAEWAPVLTSVMAETQTAERVATALLGRKHVLRVQWPLERDIDMASADEIPSLLARDFPDAWVARRDEVAELLARLWVAKTARKGGEEG